MIRLGDISIVTGGFGSSAPQSGRAGKSEIWDLKGQREGSGKNGVWRSVKCQVGVCLSACFTCELILSQEGD